jgi:phosphoglycolate phosphatase
MFEQVEAVLFDLDGTLVDSVPDLTVAVDTMMVQLGLPPRGEHKVRQWVGNGAENLIRRALADDVAGNVPQPLVDAAWPLFQAAYADSLCVHSRLYDGVLEGLGALRVMGLRMACITNKPAEFALPLVEKMGIGGFFETLLGGQCTANKKPAPDALLLAAQRLGVEIARTLMVGDSKNDVEAARNAGCCAVVVVPYGYNHGKDIRSARPDLVINAITELSVLLKKAA